MQFGCLHICISFVPSCSFPPWGSDSFRFFETMEELEAVLMTLARYTDAKSDFLSGLGWIKLDANFWQILEEWDPFSVPCLVIYCCPEVKKSWWLKKGAIKKKEELTIFLLIIMFLGADVKFRGCRVSKLFVNGGSVSKPQLRRGQMQMSYPNLWALQILQNSWNKQATWMVCT